MYVSHTHVLNGLDFIWTLTPIMHRERNTSLRRV